MPVASKANLLVAGINDLTKILTSNFHGTLEPLTDSDLNALAQTTFLLLQHADATPITSPDCAPVLRVPKGVPQGPNEIPPVPLETYHNKSKPRSQQEPMLPSPILHHSPRQHPLSQQANAVTESFTWPAPPPPDATYQTHTDTSVPITKATPGQAPTSPRKVQFAKDISSPASPTPVAAQTRPKPIKYADDIVCPSSPTSVTDHPSFQLDEAAMKWFLNGNLLV